jgi:hypothetical protein
LKIAALSHRNIESHANICSDSFVGVASLAPNKKKNQLGFGVSSAMRRSAMCFEFEYLYWAKLEEEAKNRKEDELRRQQNVTSNSPRSPSVESPGEQSESVPA